MKYISLLLFAIILFVFSLLNGFSIISNKSNDILKLNKVITDLDENIKHLKEEIKNIKKKVDNTIYRLNY